MILKLLYYTFLTPFNPLKFFRKFDQEENSRKMALGAIVLATILLTAINFQMLRSTLDSRGLANVMTVTSLAFGKVIGFIMLLGALFLMSSAFKVRVMQGRSALAIIGFSIMPTMLSLISMFQLPEQMFYIYWIMMIWKASIVALGVFALTESTIIKAIIISVGSFVLIYFFQNTIYSFLPFAISG